MGVLKVHPSSTIKAVSEEYETWTREINNKILAYDPAKKWARAKDAAVTQRREEYEKCDDSGSHETIK